MTAVPALASLLARFLLACAIAGTVLHRAPAQPSATDGASIFGQFCLSGFPDLDRIRAALTSAGWRTITQDAESVRKRPVFNEKWLPSNIREGEGPTIELRSFFGRIWCGFVIEDAVSVPIEQLAQQHGWKEDFEAGKALTSEYFRSRVFRTRANDKTVNIVLKSSPVMQEIVITHIRVLPNDPE